MVTPALEVAGDVGALTEVDVEIGNDVDDDGAFAFVVELQATSAVALIAARTTAVSHLLAPEDDACTSLILLLADVLTRRGAIRRGLRLGTARR
ncbi:MAG: hypothetical protein QOC66_1770 [Pseudonocardiales bacterium]|nr:hypothetical protein [Pseudonocardiales bacterium]